MSCIFASQSFSEVYRTKYSQKKKSSSEGERLARVLQTAGIASRRKSEELVFEGRVKVNGTTITLPQTQVDRKKDIILVDNKKIASNKQQKLFYFILNKRKGYICSNKGQKETDKLVIDLFTKEIQTQKKNKPNILIPQLFTVGRLDVNTTGMLFVTNDGIWAQKVSHPSNRVSKEYIVRIANRPTRREFEMVQNGTFIDGKMVVPQYVGMIDDGNPTRILVRIILSEGRNREVRELMENSGLKVEALKRVRIGGLKIPGDLGLGQFRVLSEKQRKQVSDYALQQSYLAQLQQGVLQ